jgi:hypothetical protein
MTSPLTVTQHRSTDVRSKSAQILDCKVIKGYIVNDFMFAILIAATGVNTKEAKMLSDQT